MTYDQQVLAKLIRHGEPLTEREWRDVGRFLRQFLKECETNHRYGEILQGPGLLVKKAINYAKKIVALLRVRR